MPSKTSMKKAAIELPQIPKDLIDQMVSSPMTADWDFWRYLMRRKAPSNSASCEATSSAATGLRGDTRRGFDPAVSSSLPLKR